MSEPESTSGSVFEIDRIRKLVELMKEHDLSEVDLRESRQRIRVCRGPKEPPRSAYAPPPPPPPAPPAPGPAAPPAAQGPAAAALANAIADAAGVRLRELPFTRSRMKAAVGL